MALSSTRSPLFFLLLAAVTVYLAACTAPLGRGYIVEKQEIQASFLALPEPHIRVVTEYHLRNTGNQNLDSLDVRLPGRRFRAADFSILWDGSPLSSAPSAENPRDTVLRFPAAWTIGAGHTVQITYDLLSTGVQEGLFNISSDAFALPAEGWTPTLPQARGVFGFGGVPPNKWSLVINVPHGFLVHASGGAEKRSAKNDQTEFRFEQTSEDLNPFVAAGRYREMHQDLPGNQRLRIWSRNDVSPAQFRQTAEALSKTIATYDSLFLARGASRPPLWIVECPQSDGCISQRSFAYSSLLYGTASRGSADMISRDTILFNQSGALSKPEALAGPALAAGWLGYGQNPGFYEQQPPMSALPAFAAALALEASEGQHVREEIIHRALTQIPAKASSQSENDAAIVRAKSLLLFYALRDRVGADAFQKGIQHMLYARRQRGFNITDLISALEQESHQAIGPFVRQWVKHPGISDEFRATYSQSNTRSTGQQTSAAEEATP